MQFRLFTAAIVFLGSYLPLSLVLLAQNIDYTKTSASICTNLASSECVVPLKNPAWALGMVLLTAACFAVTVVSLRLIKPKTEISVTSSKYIPTDLMNYTLPYIVSFMSIDYQDTGKFVGFAVFLAWMFWISYKSGQILMNPVLIALSWRLYEVEFAFAGSTAKQTATALVHGYLPPGSYTHTSVQDVFIIKP